MTKRVKTVMNEVFCVTNALQITYRLYVNIIQILYFISNNGIVDLQGNLNPFLGLPQPARTPLLVRSVNHRRCHHRLSKNHQVALVSVKIREQVHNHRELKGQIIITLCILGLISLLCVTMKNKHIHYLIFNTHIIQFISIFKHATMGLIFFS